MWSNLGLEEAISFLARNCKQNRFTLLEIWTWSGRLVWIMCWFRQLCSEWLLGWKMTGALLAILVDQGLVGTVHNLFHNLFHHRSNSVLSQWLKKWLSTQHTIPSWQAGHNCIGYHQSVKMTRILSISQSKHIPPPRSSWHLTLQHVAYQAPLHGWSGRQQGRACCSRYYQPLQDKIMHHIMLFTSIIEYLNKVHSPFVTAKGSACSFSAAPMFILRLTPFLACM